MSWTATTARSATTPRADEGRPDPGVLRGARWAALGGRFEAGPRGAVPGHGGPGPLGVGQWSDRPRALHQQFYWIAPEVGGASVRTAYISVRTTHIWCADLTRWNRSERDSRGGGAGSPELSVGGRCWVACGTAGISCSRRELEHLTGTSDRK
jgi:hypothetical protein